MFRLILSLIAFSLFTSVFGQEVTCTVSKNPVQPGEAFMITVSISGMNGEVRRQQIEGLQYLNGPSYSESRQNINGKKSSTFAYSYTYRAQKEGTIQIPSFDVLTSKGMAKTKPFSLYVTSSGDHTTGTSDFFLVLEPSKKNVIVGEPVVLKYKVYQRYRGFQIEGFDFPELKGFWNEKVEDHQGKWENISVDGKNYKVATLKIDVLFPQQSGTFKLEGFNMQAIVGSFFNSQKISATCQPVEINVAPLPAGKPQHFLGSFQQLSMQVEPSALEVKANEAITIKVTYSGSGNLKLISEPDLAWPEDLEVYDPEITDRITVSSNGMSGKRTFEYVVIPRSEGNYTLPSFNTSFYDLGNKKYKELTWKQANLLAQPNAAGSDVNYSFNGKSDVQILNQDIRYIQDVPKQIGTPGSMFFGSFSFYLIYAAPFALFILALATRKKQKNRQLDTAGYKQKRAGKELKKWLSEAAKHTNDSKLFYASLQTGLQNYLMDKFFLERSKLSRQSIQSRIHAYAGAEITNEFLALWDKTEMARFAPMPVTGIQEDLNQASQLLTKIEALK